MPITRNNQQRDILYLTCFPLAEEAASQQPFSTFSHKQLQRHLEEASSFINRFAALKLLYGEAAEPLKHLPKPKFIEAYNKDFKGKMLENTAKLGVAYVCYTYLSLNRPSEGDSDWAKSVVSKKGIPASEEEAYVQCEWLKDTWVSSAVWKELQDCLEQIRQVQPKLIVIGGKWALFFLATLLDRSEAQLTTIARTKTTFKRKIFFGELNKYRASLLKPFDCLQLPECVVVPILNPAFGWVVPDKERIMKKDYERVAGVYRRLKDGEVVGSLLEQKQKLIIAQDIETARLVLMQVLNQVNYKPTKVCFDVETRNGTIDCIGFAYQDNIGYTIPFTYLHSWINEVEEQAWYEKTVEGKKQWVLETIPAGNEITIDKNYWTLEEEAEILHLLHKVMLHPNCLHVGQNYMYDVQCYFREWGLSLHATDDTMVKHHTLYSYMQKDLALLASMYVNEYTMWKAELYGDNETRWRYNIKDVVYTLKVDKILTEMLRQEDTALQEFYLFKQLKVCKALTNLMLRGVPIDIELKEHLKKEFTLLHTHARELLQWMVHDETFNPDSPDQVKVLFKDLCGMKTRDSKGKEIRNDTQSESFGAKAMIVYLEEYPEWKALLHLYLEYKKIGTNIRNFLNAKVSEDMLMRCYYSFVKSDRLNSSKMLTGEGMNLQNIPSGTRNGFTLKECLQSYNQEDDSEMSFLDEELAVEYKSSIDLKADFGRIKDLFIPPKDSYILDLDFSAIDLNWVALEANCKWVLDILRSGDCVYRVLAELYYGYPVTKKMEERQVFKAIVHGTNYLGFPATLAAAAGLSVPEVQRIREFYKGKCPEIWEWHRRLENEAKTKGFIRNYFGGRYWGVNMNDISNPTWRNKLVALQPQSSAGILVNQGICALEEKENPTKFNRVPIFDAKGCFERLEHSFNPDVVDKKGIKTVMQVHDSSVMLAKKDDVTAIRRIIEYFSIELKYPVPITIPVGVKASAKSYGDCNEDFAKELLAKADEYILSNPNWRNERCM